MIFSMLLSARELQEFKFDDNHMISTQPKNLSYIRKRAGPQLLYKDMIVPFFQIMWY